jgi:predicted nucleotidyltransferase
VINAGAAFGADDIRQLLTELGARLDRRGVQARIFIVGGAAMALAYSQDRLTRDIDAVFEPAAVVREEAAKVADERGLPGDWLNDGVKGFMPNKVKNPPEAAGFVAPGISVGIATPEYMLAMKASASRLEADEDDLRKLVHLAKVRSVDHAMEIVERHYDRRLLQPKVQFTLAAIVEDEVSKDR